MSSKNDRIEQREHGEKEVWSGVLWCAECKQWIKTIWWPDHLESMGGDHEYGVRSDSESDRSGGGD